MWGPEQELELLLAPQAREPSARLPLPERPAQREVLP